MERKNNSSKDKEAVALVKKNQQTIQPVRCRSALVLI
jgi:hypothetical protein